MIFGSSFHSHYYCNYICGNFTSLSFCAGVLGGPVVQHYQSLEYLTSFLGGGLPLPGTGTRSWSKGRMKKFSKFLSLHDFSNNSQKSKKTKTNTELSRVDENEESRSNVGQVWDCTVGVGVGVGLRLGLSELRRTWESIGERKKIHEKILFSEQLPETRLRLLFVFLLKFEFDLAEKKLLKYLPDNFFSHAIVFFLVE